MTFEVVPVVPALARPDPARFDRRLRRRRGRRGLFTALLTLVVPHFWVGMFLLAMAVLELTEPLVAEPTTAIVVDTWQEPLNKKSARLQVLVFGEFHGERLQHQLSLDPEKGNVLERGDPITLQVADIGEIRSIKWSEEGVSWFVVVSAFFWNLVVAAVAWQLTVRPLMQWWLLRHGAMVRGEVLRFDLSSEPGCVDVDYRYTPAGGGPPIESTVSLPAGQARMLPPVVDVCHHPKRPGWSVISNSAAWAIDPR